MNIVEFIKEYQTLIGSFLAIFSTVSLWYLKGIYNNKQLLENNKKEIENIFFLATRESEDALKDIKMYIVEARRSLEEIGEKINISIPPKLNRIYVNEERLFLLKNNLGFIISQQIDIAVSSAKKFNGYLDQIESVPIFIFDSIIKMIGAGIITKEEAIKNYKTDQTRYLNNTEAILSKDIHMVQIHLFRPIVVQSSKYQKLPVGFSVDKQLDMEAGILLTVMKQEAGLE